MHVLYTVTRARIVRGGTFETDARWCDIGGPPFGTYTRRFDAVMYDTSVVRGGFDTTCRVVKAAFKYVGCVSQ